jgi:hypothetical protein
MSLVRKALSAIFKPAAVVSAINLGIYLDGGCNMQSVEGLLGGVQCNGHLRAVGYSEWGCTTLAWNANPLLEYDDNGDFHLTAQSGYTFCGIGRFDAYPQCQGSSHYNLYISGGDGKEVGYCYPVSGLKDTCYIWPVLIDYNQYGYYEIYGDEVPNPC